MDNSTMTCIIGVFANLCSFFYTLILVVQTSDVLRFVCLSRLNGMKLGFSVYGECDSW
jgi:hypothetical protein